jgi:hypothetical protein
MSYILLPVRFIRKYFGTIAALILLGLVVFAWLNRLDIYDWTRLRNYTPPAEIAQLATETTMKDSARRLFYVQRPVLEDKNTFNQHCDRSEQTIILGCYVPREGIYIFRVVEPRLEGIEQVTAAHELLHAAYERLGGKEKQRIDSLLRGVYERLNNQRILSTIDQYKQAGADINNELHSILGSEVRNLGDELETYYRKYFNDRQAIVGFSENYEQAFVSIKTQVEDYDKQLESLKKQVEANEQNLNSLAAKLEADRSRMDGLLASGQVGAYNSSIPAFNASVRSYNNLVGQTKALIDQYNAKLADRNSLALQEQELFKAIDSRLATEETK